MAAVLCIQLQQKCWFMSPLRHQDACLESSSESSLRHSLISGTTGCESQERSSSSAVASLIAIVYSLLTSKVPQCTLARSHIHHDV